MIDDTMTYEFVTCAKCGFTTDLYNAMYNHSYYYNKSSVYICRECCAKQRKKAQHQLDYWG